MNDFLKKLFSEAQKAGVETAEAFLLETEKFEAVAMDAEITQYSSNATRGLGFRAMMNGRMGYASTEAFDEDAIEQLVQGVMDSARLCEDTDEQFLYDGVEPDPEVELYNAALQEVSPQQKLDFVLELEREAKAYDPRIEKVGYNTVLSGLQTVRIVNTCGIDKQYTENYFGAYLQPIAHEGDSTCAGMEVAIGRDFDKINAKELASAASKIAVEALHASPVPSGSYRVIFENVAMVELLGAFAESFSAENAQKGLSLLKGKLGEKIAADCVTLVDDPLRPGGLASRPFDAEGVPSARHTVIENGMFCTFLHNLKTARKDGVQTTANASKASYASSVRVSPSNFYFEPGSQSLAEMMAVAKDGIVITEVDGLHAGADAISGDFSLLSKGYAFEDGVRKNPVEQITVAGNFFAMLQSVRAFADDLRFPQTGIGSASVDVGELSVAGT